MGDTKYRYPDAGQLRNLLKHDPWRTPDVIPPQGNQTLDPHSLDRSRADTAPSGPTLFDVPNWLNFLHPRGVLSPQTVRNMIRELPPNARGVFWAGLRPDDPLH